METVAVLKACGAAVLAAVCAVAVRELHRGFDIPVRLAAMLVLGTCALAVCRPAVVYISELMEASPLSEEAIKLVFKAFATAWLTHAGSAFCTELGASRIAEALELVGCAEITVLSLPLISQAIDAVERLVGEAGVG